MNALSQRVRPGAHSPRANSGERGAVVVEFALVSLMLILLLVGATECGRAWYTVHMLSSAAREGARVGALLGGGAEREAAIRARVGEVLEPTGIDEFEVEILLMEGDGYGKPLRVEVQSEFTAVAPRLIPGLDRPLTLKGAATFNQEIP
jgi:hypothetical protein